MESREWKIGDSLIYNYRPKHNLTPGKVYVAGGIHFDEGPHRIGIVADDNGNPEGWLREYFINIGNASKLSDLEKFIYNVENL